MNTLARIKELCKARGITLTQLEKELDFGNGSLAKSASMKSERIVVIANHFGISTDYLLGVVDEVDGHYIDPEAAALAQEMATRPELKVLLSASRDVSKEDLEVINQMVLRMADKNR